MAKKISIILFSILLLLMFAIGYVKVYTISYNAFNRSHITDFYFHYSKEDRTFYAIIGGNSFQFDI